MCELPGKAFKHCKGAGFNTPINILICKKRTKQIDRPGFEYLRNILMVLSYHRTLVQSRKAVQAEKVW